VCVRRRAYRKPAVSGGLIGLPFLCRRAVWSACDAPGYVFTNENAVRAFVMSVDSLTFTCKVIVVVELPYVIRVSRFSIRL